MQVKMVSLVDPALLYTQMFKNILLYIKYLKPFCLTKL